MQLNTIPLATVFLKNLNVWRPGIKLRKNPLNEQKNPAIWIYRVGTLGCGVSLGITISYCL